MYKKKLFKWVNRPDNKNLPSSFEIIYYKMYEHFKSTLVPLKLYANFTHKWREPSERQRFEMPDLGFEPRSHV